MNEPPARARKMSYRGVRTWIEEISMDIALMVAAVVFFFWQTVSE